METSELRECLLALEAELRAARQQAQREAKAPPLDKCADDRLSRLQAAVSREMARDHAGRCGQQLNNIRAALERLDAGQYGFCSVCGEAIDSRRLEVDPAVARCTHCAMQAEGG